MSCATCIVEMLYPGCSGLTAHTKRKDVCGTCFHSIADHSKSRLDELHVGLRFLVVFFFCFSLLFSSLCPFSLVCDRPTLPKRVPWALRWTMTPACDNWSARCMNWIWAMARQKICAPSAEDPRTAAPLTDSRCRASIVRVRRLRRLVARGRQRLGPVRLPIPRRLPRLAAETRRATSGGPLRPLQSRQLPR